MRRLMLLFLAIIFVFAPVAIAQTSAASATDIVSLPAPATSGGMTLTEALQKRRSTRNYTNVALTQQEISQLLWAAQGITDAKGHRTAPSAMGKYFLTIYVATADGLFQYMPDGHKLKKLSGTDLRAKLSQQPSVSSAPAVFIITGDYARAKTSLNAPADIAPRFVDLEAGHATQNLLLQATAIQLAGVSAGGIDPAQIAQAASLPESSRPIYLAPVGHPKP
jgi:SagB-type dehydrogenase family enzyme